MGAEIRWFEPTPEQLSAYEEFVGTRPPEVADVARQFTPWTMYKLATTGQRARVIGFHEADPPKPPVTVYLRVENPILGPATARNVFGIDPKDVVPWTSEDEPEGRMRRGVSEDLEVEEVNIQERDGGAHAVVKFKPRGN